METLNTKQELNNSFEFFVNYIHKRLTGEAFTWHDHNKAIVKDLLSVYKLELMFLIINIPPRLGKSTLILYFIAWTMFKNKLTYNNYYTYSDLLVARAYKIVSDIFDIPDVEAGADLAYKRKKDDFSNDKNGGLFAMTTLGQVTGFGAGRKDKIDEFNGCIVIDDPLKANDSFLRQNNANKAIKSAVLTRKNNSKVPIVLIMQRLSLEDTTAFIKKIYGKLFENGKAKHLVIPVLKNGVSISEKEYPIELLEIERENDPATFYAQLMQAPQNIEGGIFTEKIFDYSSPDPSKQGSIATIHFNKEDTTQPVVFLAFKKEGKNLLILDYAEDEPNPETFFNDLKIFCTKNGVKVLHIPQTLDAEVLTESLRPIKTKAITEKEDISLNAFYALAQLRDNKIVIQYDEDQEAFKKELKAFPKANRDFSTKAIVNAINIALGDTRGKISRAI